MTKKQIRLAGYDAIVKENKSHQEAFDDITSTQGIDRKLVAQELSKIPSSGKQKSTSTLRYIFIAALALLAAMRILTIVLLGIEGNINGSIIGLLVLFGVVIPGVGIYAALFSKVELYMGTGIFLSVSLFRALMKGEMTADPETLIGLIPFAVAVALAFFIPTKLKTPYKRNVVEHYIDGKLNKKVEYVFEDTRLNQADILDGNSFT